MQEEGGVTQVSLENIAELFELYGPVLFIEHSEYGEPSTTIFFEKGPVYTATGFAASYWGEGPAGLVKLIMKYLDRADIGRKQVSAWEKGKVYLVLRGQGLGQARSYYPGVMDCEYDLEVW